MATDENGDSILYTEKPYPVLSSNSWWVDCGVVTMALASTSFKPGTCNWEDSLVVRPE